MATDAERSSPTNEKMATSEEKTTTSSGEKTTSDVPQPILFQSDTVYSRFKGFYKKVVRNITLEPVLVFLSIVSSMDGVSVGQLVIEKSCNRDFNFTEEICDNLLDHQDENTQVQNEVAQFKVYESTMSHVFPVLISFFLGSWSDIFGRKILLYIYFGLRLIEGCFLLLNAYFIDWPKEYLLFTVNLPVALSGGYVTYYMGINSFIADISRPEQRSFRMAMVNLMTWTGTPIGTILGANLFEAGGYVCVIGATLVGRIVSFVFLVITLERFKYKPKEARSDEAPKRHRVLSPNHVVDSIRTAFKKRPNNKRFYLWVYLSVMIAIYLPMFGESTIGYNYVRTKFGWGVEEYSTYRTVTDTVDIVVQIVLIPLLGYLQIRDSLLVVLLLTTTIARDLMKAFGSDPLMYYLGSMVNVMGGYAFASCRSIISQCVDNNELGKVFALLSSLESLVPIGMSQAYASLWKATSSLEYPWVGSVFMVSSGIISIAFLVALFSLISLHGKSIAEDDGTPVTKPTYRGPRRRLSLTVGTAGTEFPPQYYFHGYDTFDNGAPEELPTSDNGKSDQINSPKLTEI